MTMRKLIYLLLCLKYIHAGHKKSYFAAGYANSGVLGNFMTSQASLAQSKPSILKNARMANSPSSELTKSFTIRRRVRLSNLIKFEAVSGLKLA
jgi:hypothetical protein